MSTFEQFVGDPALDMVFTQNTNVSTAIATNEDVYNVTTRGRLFMITAHAATSSDLGQLILTITIDGTNPQTIDLNPGVEKKLLAKTPFTGTDFTIGIYVDIPFKTSCLVQAQNQTNTNTIAVATVSGEVK